MVSVRCLFVCLRREGEGRGGRRVEARRTPSKSQIRCGFGGLDADSVEYPRVVATGTFGVARYLAAHDAEGWRSGWCCWTRPWYCRNDTCAAARAGIAALEGAEAFTRLTIARLDVMVVFSLVVWIVGGCVLLGRGTKRRLSSDKLLGSDGCLSGYSPTYTASCFRLPGPPS